MSVNEKKALFTFFCLFKKVLCCNCVVIGSNMHLRFSSWFFLVVRRSKQFDLFENHQTSCDPKLRGQGQRSIFPASVLYESCMLILFRIDLTFPAPSIVYSIFFKQQQVLLVGLEAAIHFVWVCALPRPRFS